ncbi:hypothetical protein K461DRAFT_311837 [Myriangium duriaei CBS 260.36]|uniref:Uncharacterized protein n=1 Tax=Myriangium duriaei CBS 260.36 TaxID=1168546 RepID=A0A9P4ML31_9PEZI|nr:hypothetical protein K461DRAFT_311837 [Myriangium duriaei CBS 260.36]
MRTPSPISKARPRSTTRNSSASSSLQHNLAKDVELSLNKTAKHYTWRDSTCSKVDNPTLRSHRSFSSARGSLRSLRHGQQEDIAEGHRASSLRRVMTTSSRRSKRSPLLVNLMAKRSTTKLQGPEEFFDDSSTSRSNSSPARASLQSLCKADSPRSKNSNASSHGSATPVKDHERRYTTEDSPARPSSPIPIPNSSPPPTIEFEIESGKMSPHCLFELGEPTTSDYVEPITVLPVDVSTSENVIINRKRSKRQIIKDELKALKEERIPRRSSNDHWRLRRASRTRPSKLPEPVLQHSIESELSSLIPGTNLPLEDPFDTSAPLAKSDSENGKVLNKDQQVSRLGLDGAIGQCRLFDEDPGLEQQLIGHLQSPRAGHIDAVSGQWVSNDPAARQTTPTRSCRIGSLHSYGNSSTGLHLPQQAAKELATGQVLLESDPGVLSPKTLRSELEASRKALERMEDRMASIEAELRKNASPDVTPTATKGRLRMFNNTKSSPIPKGLDQDDHQSQDSVTSSPITSDITSSKASYSSSQSLLEVQELFYPSDSETWDARPARPQNISEDADSAWSEAREHLQNMQKVASNGASPTEPLAESWTQVTGRNLRQPSEVSEEAGIYTGSLQETESMSEDDTSPAPMNVDPSEDDLYLPSMGSLEDFLRQHQERAVRYNEVFHENTTNVCPGPVAGHFGLGRATNVKTNSSRITYNSDALFPFAAEEPYGGGHIFEANRRTTEDAAVLQTSA